VNKFVTAFVLMGLVAGAAVAAPDPGVWSTRLCLGGNLIMLNREGGGSAFLGGVAIRVDFDLGRAFILAPEASAGLGGWSAGGTLNIHVGPLFAGAGALVVGATKGGSSGEWGTNAFLKVHVGTRSFGTYLALSALFGDSIKGFGATIGYVF